MGRKIRPVFIMPLLVFSDWRLQHHLRSFFLPCGQLHHFSNLRGLFSYGESLISITFKTADRTEMFLSTSLSSMDIIFRDFIAMVEQKNMDLEFHFLLTV